MAYRQNKRKRNGKRPKEHNGEGSYKEYRLRNGEMKLSYTFTYKDINGKSKRKTVTGISEVDCNNKKEDFLRKELRNLPENLKNATIVQLVELQRDINIKTNKCHEAGDSRNESTQKIFERLPVDNPIGFIPIKDITESTIERFRNELPDRYSQSVIRKIYIQLRQAFKLAVRKKIIDENLLDDPELNTAPTSKIKTKTVNAFTPSEEKEFFELLDNIKIRKNGNDYRLQLHISQTTGLRMGEINALTIDSVNLKKKVIYVNKTISRSKKYRPVLKSGTKTKKGTRVVPISDAALPYLEKAVNNFIPNSDNLLFYDHKKKSYITTQQVNDWTKRFCKKNNIRYEGVHMIRHTFATNCARNGMPINILAEILGHEDTKVTMKYYITIENEDKSKALNDVINNMKKQEA